ncbi:hypothetical protein GCK32_011360, partial [Trichostrongylus colubriformis]
IKITGIRTTWVLTAIITRLTMETAQELIIPCQLLAITPRWTLGMTSLRGTTTTKHFTMTFILNQRIMKVEVTGEITQEAKSMTSRVTMDKTMIMDTGDTKMAIKDQLANRSEEEEEWHVRLFEDSLQDGVARCHHRCTMVKQLLNSNHQRFSVGVELHRSCQQCEVALHRQPQRRPPQLHLLLHAEASYRHHSVVVVFPRHVAEDIHHFVVAIRDLIHRDFHLAMHLHHKVHNQLLRPWLIKQQD